MKAAIYTRVSTEDQAREGFSLHVQRQVLTDLVKQNGWQLVCSIPGKDIYEDDGYSGGTMERPAFKILRDDASRKLFDVILVYKLDRLNRKLKDLLGFLEELDVLGLNIKSATEPFDTTTSAGKFLVHMLGSSAEFERNRLVERVVPGMMMGVKKGHWQGARYAPFGYSYSKENKRLEVVPEEAKIVKNMFEMYLAGNSTSKIAGLLYKEGVPTRSGGKFHTKLICDILHNKVYLGKLVWNKHHYDTKQKTSGGKGYRYIKNSADKVIEVDDVHEKIIDPKIFELVQERMKKNARASTVKYKNNTYYLSGVTYCGVCGMKYTGVMIVTHHKKGIKKPWYRCIGKSYPYIKCSNKQVTAEKLHGQILWVLKSLAEKKEIEEGLDKLIQISSKEPSEHYQSELHQKQEALNRNLEKQKEFSDLFDNDLINIHIYKEKAQALREEEKKLKGEVVQLQMLALDHERGVDQRLKTQQFLRSLRTRNYQWSDSDIKEFIRVLFKRIVVKDDKVVTVEMHLPWNLLFEKELQCLTQQLTQAMEKDPYAYLVSPSAVK